MYNYGPCFFEGDMAKKDMKKSTLSALCGELGLLLKTGMTPYDALSVVADGSDGEERALCTRLMASLETGTPFWQCLEEAGSFPSHMVEMVRTGEQTGNTERVFLSLASFYDREARNASAIRSAVVYPAVIFLLLMAVQGVLIIKVLPVFSTVFTQLGAVMPPLARAFLGIGTWMVSNKWLVLLAMAAFAGGLGWVITHSEGFARFWANSTRAGQKQELAAFASALAMGINSGMDTDASLEAARRLVTLRGTKDKIAAAASFMSEGEGFAQALSKAAVFEQGYCRMLDIGIKTGNADSVMADIAARLEEDAGNALSRATGAVEPALVVLMSVMTGVLLMSVMLPLSGIMSSIG